MDTIELKKKFLQFFRKKDHNILDFAPLIPENDPTVLFTTAGMHPLVPFLMGQEHPLGKKLASCQICIRTTDIEEVGNKCHFTFFEMLGNWSIGDYFKKQAIEYAYEFLVSKEYLNLDKNKLSFTCFIGEQENNIPKDTEAASSWEALGVSKKRIAFLNRKENWWGPAGSTGPCGPDSEIYYWSDTKNKAPEIFDPNDSRWVEIWNLVFMEYNKNKDGTYTKLKQKNIDTGLGVERVCAILNGKEDVFFDGKIKKILDFTKSLVNTNNKDIKQEVYLKSYKIIVDHIRAAVFILGDNRAIIPSNVDQGYVLRRLIRRAIRSANMIGINNKFVSKIANKIIELYKDEYKHIKYKENFIIEQLNAEENKFSKTLEKGLKEFNKLANKVNEITGKDAFLLYQSYGFPIEVINDLAKERNIKVNTIGFYNEYKKHQDLSRIGAKKKFAGGLSEDNLNTRKLHTATHILNEVLRKYISSDIKQKGSNINSERLRFDFNFSRKLTSEELELIENKVNKIIKENLEVTKEKMKLEQAIECGAQAEFGTKYPKEVWVYSIGNFSKEICMGPHVNQTSELGTFKIKKEQSVASGIRRIKAILI